MSDERQRSGESEPRTTVAADLARWIAIASALAVAVAAAAYLARWSENRDRLLELLHAAGIEERNPQAVVRVARERSPDQARLTTARALVYDAMSPAAGVSSRERAEHLAAAERLARQALRSHPDSWQGYTLLGTSIYLKRSLERDPALATAYRDWEAPLRRAIERSGKAEPRRLLAAAYLETWTALGEEKKAAARELLAGVFRDDPRAFDQLAATWLEVAESREEAFDLVPDRPEAWRRLETHYARAGDWETYSNVYRQRLDALEAENRRKLAQAELRSRLGDRATARELCLDVLATSPPSLRFVPLVVQALRIYPPGLQSRRSVDSLEHWLRWALELDAIGRNPLPPRSAARLIDAVGRLDPAQAARVALLAEDVYAARLAERQSELRTTVVWAPYLIAKARRLLELDAASYLEEARQALAEVDLASRATLPYWFARRELDHARQDRAALREAEAEIDARRAREWSALDWRYGEEGAHLLLLPAGAATGLRLELRPSSPGGAAVAVLFDGELAAVEALRRPRTVTLAVSVEPRLHLVELRPLAGGNVVAGRVELRSSRAREKRPGNTGEALER